MSNTSLSPCTVKDAYEEVLSFDLGALCLTAQSVGTITNSTENFYLSWRLSSEYSTST